MSHKVSRENPLQELPMDVTVLAGQNSTVAAVTWFDGAAVIHATGEAKRMPGDVTNDAVGVNLAVGRAFAKIGQHLVSAALKQTLITTE